MKPPLVGVTKFLGSQDMRIPMSSWMSLMSVLKKVSTTTKSRVTIRVMVLTTDYRLLFGQGNAEKYSPLALGLLPPDESLVDQL